MSPLAPLRALLLGMMSWAVLGLGVYCLWEGYDRQRHQDAQPRPVLATSNIENAVPDAVDTTELPENLETSPSEPTALVVDHRRPAWPYLAGGVLLLLWSLGGRWPTTLLLSSGSKDIPKPQGREIKIAGADSSQLAVEIFDHPTARTLLFTHGWSLDRSAWSYAVQRLHGDHRVVTWDLPGLGGSAAPDDKQYSIERMAEALHAVVNSVHNGQPIYLIGHSIGGMIVQTYLRLHPDDHRIAGIQLVHTTYTDPLKTMIGASVWSSIENSVVVPLNWLAIGLAPIIYLMNWQSYFNGSMQMTTRFTSFTGRQSHQQLNHAAYLGAKAWPAHIARGNLAMLRFDSQDVLPNLNLPVQVIAGKHDRITKPIASERIADLAAQTRPTYVAGGHLSIWEFEQDELRSIQTHLNEPAPTSKEPSRV